MSNIGKPRNVHLWTVGSKLVENTVENHPYYWVITEMKDGKVKVDSHSTKTGEQFNELDEYYYITSLTNLSLAENKVYNTELARVLYPDAREEGEWLILEL